MNDLPYMPVDAATGWVCALTDPLVSPRRREVFEDAMAQVAARHPAWSLAFFGGSITTVMSSLPPSDPWRQAESFDWQDALDLVVPVFTDPRSDPQLIAISDGITSASAAVLAHTRSASWTECAEALDAGVDEEMTRIASAIGKPEIRRGYLLRDIARSALVWALFRRRCYTGFDDPWSQDVMLTWAARAGVAAETGLPLADFAASPAGLSLAADVAASVHAGAVTDTTRATLLDSIAQFRQELNPSPDF